MSQVRALAGGRFVAVEIDTDRVRDMWQADWTVGRIADAVGVSRGTMGRVLAGLGLRRPTGWKPPGFSAWTSRGMRVVNRAAEPVPVAGGDEQAAIAQFISQNGITRCPTAAVARTSAILPPDDVAALEQYEASRARAILPGPRAAAARWKRKREAEAVATRWRNTAAAPGPQPKHGETA